MGSHIPRGMSHGIRLRRPGRYILHVSLIGAGCLLSSRLLLPHAILSAIWDRQGAELVAWDCLLEGDSFVEVMSSDLHQSAWVRNGELLG